MKNVTKNNFLIAILACLTCITVMAQSPDHTFNYQGQLLDDGSPPTGSYDIRVTAHINGVTGMVYGKESEHLATDVNKGLFNLSNVDIVDPSETSPLDGLELHLEIAVKPAGAATYEILSPRQVLHAVPYANNLTVNGATDNQVLTFVSDGIGGGTWIGQDNTHTAASPWTVVGNEISYGGHAKLTRTTDATLNTGSGTLVLGDESALNLVMDGNEILARDNGAAATLYVGVEGGAFTNGTPANKGLFSIGDNPSQITFDGDDIQKISNGNPANLFINFFGGGTYLSSLGELTSIRGRLTVREDVKQPIASNGMMKYMVDASCSGAVPVINKSYNGVSNTVISISTIGIAGECIIDFPNDINDRYWQASAKHPTGSRGVTCSQIGVNTDQLKCTRFNTLTGAGVNGGIMILVY